VVRTSIYDETRRPPRERGPRALAVAGLLLVAGAVMPGCRLFSRHSPTTQNANVSPADAQPLAQAQAVLEGRASGILVAANGGATGSTAEANTRAALKSAVALNVPMAVMDVSQEADGTLVLGRSLIAPGRDAQPSTEQGPVLPAASQPEPTPLPTLAETLKLIDGRILLGIRLCGARSADVVAAVERAGLGQQVIVFAETPSDAQAARECLRRKTPVRFLFDASTPEGLSHIEATPPWPALVALGPQTLNLQNIARIQAIGAKVLVHQRRLLLVRIGSNLAPYHKMGVSIVLTDWPRQLLKEMRQINQW